MMVRLKMIKLTSATATEFDRDGNPNLDDRVFIAPAFVVAVYSDMTTDDTWISMAGGYSHLVKEGINEVMKALGVD